MDRPTNRSTQPPRTTEVHSSSTQYSSSTAQHTAKKKHPPNNPRTRKVCTIIVQQQYSRTAENTRNYCMPETREGIADKTKTKQKKQCHCGTPNHARAGPVWRCLPLHASPRLALAECVHSRRCVQQYVSYSSTCVGEEFVPVSCRDEQQHNMRWYPGTVLGFPFFYDSPPSRGASDLSAGEPLDAPRWPRWSSESVLSASLSEGCYVGRAWSHREAAGGQVELGSRSFLRGMLQQNYCQRSK